VDDDGELVVRRAREVRSFEVRVHEVRASEIRWSWLTVTGFAGDAVARAAALGVLGAVLLDAGRVEFAGNSFELADQLLKWRGVVPRALRLTRHDGFCQRSR
jgi:hypothetical protein